MKTENKSIGKAVAILIAIILGTLCVIVFLLWQSEKQSIKEDYTAELILLEERRLEGLNEVIANYNDLYASYQELYQRYHQMAAEKGFYDEWDEFEVTAYTSSDIGCNSYSSIGMNIEQWNDYFNFAAVDPELIPYGSIVLVKFQTGIEPFLAADCGGAIKGKHIDLYYGRDLPKAFDFGVKNLEVKVIN